MKRPAKDPKRSGNFETLTSDHTDLETDKSVKFRRRIKALSILGFIPFLVSSVLLVTMDQINPTVPIIAEFLKLYSAIVISFLAGIRWGLALKSNATHNDLRDVFISCLPPAIAWLSMLLPITLALATQVILFAGLGAWDTLTGERNPVDNSYIQLRVVLTLLVCFTLVVSFFATMHI